VKLLHTPNSTHWLKKRKEGGPFLSNENTFQIRRDERRIYNDEVSLRRSLTEPRFSSSFFHSSVQKSLNKKIYKNVLQKSLRHDQSQWAGNKQSKVLAVLRASFKRHWGYPGRRREAKVATEGTLRVPRLSWRKVHLRRQPKQPCESSRLQIHAYLTRDLRLLPPGHLCPHAESIWK